MRTARPLYAGEDLGLDLDNTIYALDSTTIDLTLSLFPWADFRQTKAGIKMHTQIDLCGPIPTCIHITGARQHDVGWLDSLFFEAGAFYLMDRGYMDFVRLGLIAKAGAFFVTRAKTNLQFTRHYSMIVDRLTGLRSDHVGKPTLEKSRRAFPMLLRRVKYVDLETGKEFVFLTNNLEIPALTDAMLYKLRWRIELFFRWIKGHLRIKHYYGICLLSALRFHDLTSQNPHEVWLAIGPKDRLPKTGNPPIKIVRFGAEHFQLGLKTHEIEGARLRVYSVARTVVDLFRYRNKIGIDVALEALKEGWQERRFTLKEINDIATRCHMTRVMKPYLDLLGFGPNDPASLRSIVLRIIQVPCPEDGLTFDEGSMAVAPIREDMDYGGVRAKFRAKLGNIRIPIQIDVGYGDAITPGPEMREYPTLLSGMPGMELKTYPPCTVIAEKFEALVRLDAQNSRISDFFDLDFLLADGVAEPRNLDKAIRATFKRRGSILPSEPPTGPESGNAVAHILPLHLRPKKARQTETEEGNRGETDQERVHW